MGCLCAVRRGRGWKRGGRGGGVAVVVNNTLNCCRCPDFDAKSFESNELLITAISHTIRWL